MTGGAGLDPIRASASRTERLYEVAINGTQRLVGVERRDGRYLVRLDGRVRSIDLASVDRSTLSLLFPEEHGRVLDVAIVEINGSAELSIHVNGRSWGVRVEPAGALHKRPVSHGSGRGSKWVTAPMFGKVVRMLVAPGDVVRARQAVAIVEAMKMENELRASKDGVVKEVLVREGASVDAGAPLMLIE